MKSKLLFLCLLFLSSWVRSQIVNIPDETFKFVCVNFLVVDTDGDGFLDDDVDTNDDGEIQVSEAEAVEYFFPRGAGILSLEGIQAFVNLKSLNCSQNSLSTMDLSQNVLLEDLACFFNVLEDLDVSALPNLKTLSCDFNELTALDVTSNPDLERLDFPFNQISEIDLSQNFNLVRLDGESNGMQQIDLSQNVNLEVVSLENNLISTIDLSPNSALRVVDLHNNLFNDLDLSLNSNLDKLWCYENDLMSLNIKNGNNMGISLLNAVDNPNLECVEVDDPVFANNQSGWNVDETAIYSIECLLGIETLEFLQLQLVPNPVSDRLTLHIEESVAFDVFTIRDVLGRMVFNSVPTGNTIDVSGLESGVFFLTLVSENGTFTKQFIKQ